MFHVPHQKVEHIAQVHVVVAAARTTGLWNAETDHVSAHLPFVQRRLLVTSVAWCPRSFVGRGANHIPISLAVVVVDVDS